MRVLIAFTIVLNFAGSCKSSCEDQFAKKYKHDRSKLVQEKTVNDFSISLSYFPSVMLPSVSLEQKDRTDKSDSDYYYFRLTVDFDKKGSILTGDRSALYYGIDSLFATTEGANANIPIHVEPVMNGNSKKMEYLIVFDRTAFARNEPMRIIFYDRLFTNTKMVFEFNRNNIDELESISC
ncbi:MAG TPA: hypothetical protein VGD17_16490 [Chitinophagaceae bacterium]